MEDKHFEMAKDWDSLCMQFADKYGDLFKERYSMPGIELHLDLVTILGFIQHGLPISNKSLDYKLK